MNVIYALVDETGEPRYVGQTAKRLQQRLAQHASNARNGGKRQLDKWIRSCPSVSIIPLEVEPADADVAERKWIAQMRSGGIELLNRYDGGRRSPTGQVWSDEQRKRMSETRKGKPLSPEHRAKLSAAHTGVPIGDAHRAAIGNGGRGLKRSAESRERLRAAKLGDLNPMSRAQRAKREQAQQGGEAL